MKFRAAVDVDDLAGDEGRVFGSQEIHRADEVLGLLVPPEHAGMRRLPERVRREELLDGRGRRQPRGDGVDRDAVFTDDLGQRAGQADQAGFGADVRALFSVAPVDARGAKEADPPARLALSNGSKLRVTRKGPSRLTAMISRHWA